MSYEEVGSIDGGCSDEDGEDHAASGTLTASGFREEVAGGELDEEARGDGEKDDGGLFGEGPPDGGEASEERSEGVGGEEGIVRGAGGVASGGEQDGVHAVAEIVSGDAYGDGIAGGVGGGVGETYGHAIAEAVKDEHGSADATDGAARVGRGLPMRCQRVEHATEGEAEQEGEERDAKDVGGVEARGIA